MKRWNVQFNDCSIQKYYENLQTAKKANPTALTITENIDYTYLQYIEKIQSAATEIFCDYRGRKIYKIPHAGGHILVQLWSDIEGGSEFYYDGCQYQRHDEGSLVEPITWTFSAPHEFYKKFLKHEIQDVSVVCERKYGQSKLTKPSACNNANLIGSVDFSFGEKPVKCKVWKNNNVVYVLHRDWFSDCISFDEAERRGMIDKKQRGSKFIYDDNFGCVVLRNEAMLSFGIPNSKSNLVRRFSSLLGVEWYGLHNLCRWEDFFADILELCEKQPHNLK